MIIDRETTALVVDSTADLPDELLHDPNVTMVPLTVHFGEESYLDWAELRPEQFFQKLVASPTLPTTSQPSLGTWLQTYRTLREHYAQVYSIHMNAGYGGSFATACIAARELDGVTVVDSQVVTSGEALLVGRLLARLDAGTPQEEFDAYIEYFRQHSTFFTLIKELVYAHKGGRLGKASYLVGNVLGIKPIIEIKRETQVFRKARGERAAMRALRDGFLERTDPGGEVYLAFAHALNLEWLEELRGLILSTDRHIHEQPTSTVGSVIGVYAGPGTVGIGFIQE